jgi:transcriptional regulator with XRE-family HTH domain
MKIFAVKRAAREYGLLKLSKKTGLARSYLYKVIEGESSPTLEAFDKILRALGFKVELYRLPMVDSIQDVSEKVAQYGDWQIHFFNFVDAFRRTKNPKLIAEQPVNTLGEKERAILASIVFELCLELGVGVPRWASSQRPLKEPWFVAGVENLKAMALVESPVSFRRNNIFVLGNFLARA